jgi:hypothetical protein
MCHEAHAQSRPQQPPCRGPAIPQKARHRHQPPALPPLYAPTPRKHSLVRSSSGFPAGQGCARWSAAPGTPRPDRGSAAQVLVQTDASTVPETQRLSASGAHQAGLAYRRCDQCTASRAQALQEETHAEINPLLAIITHRRTAQPGPHCRWCRTWPRLEHVVQTPSVPQLCHRSTKPKATNDMPQTTISQTTSPRPMCRLKYCNVGERLRMRPIVSSAPDQSRLSTVWGSAFHRQIETGRAHCPPSCCIPRHRYVFCVY